MKVAVAVFAALLLFAGVAFASGDDNAITRERVSEWHDKLFNTVNFINAFGGGASGLRAWSMMTLAMFDAANLIDGKYETYLKYQPSAVAALGDISRAEPLAAASAAARIVLDGLVNAVPASVAPAATKTNLLYSHLSQLTIHLGMLRRNARADARIAAGVAVGNFVGQQMLLNRTGDGHPPNNCNSFPNPATAACPNFVPNGTVWFEYQYNLPYHPGQPNSPGYPQVKPFGIPSYAAAEFAVPPPPAPQSPAFQVDFAETWAYGTQGPNSARTAETSAIAQFHDGNFASQIGFASDYLATSGIQVDGVDLLRGVALSAVASHDSHATHWKFKYTHYAPRPIAAFRQVTSDFPNLFQYREDNWTPVLITSQTPEYPSGHSARSGGAAYGFIKAFGDVPRNGVFRTISFSSPNQGERVYSSISQFYGEIQNSRVYGGVHFRSACNAGANLAQRVTDYVFKNLAPLADCDDK